MAFLAEIWTEDRFLRSEYHMVTLHYENSIQLTDWEKLDSWRVMIRIEVDLALAVDPPQFVISTSASTRSDPPFALPRLTRIVIWRIGSAPSLDRSRFYFIWPLAKRCRMGDAVQNALHGFRKPRKSRGRGLRTTTGW